MALTELEKALQTKIEVLRDLEATVMELMATHEAKRELWFPSEVLGPKPGEDPDKHVEGLRKRAVGMLVRGYEQVDWPWPGTGDVAHSVVAEITGIPGGRPCFREAVAFEKAIHGKAAHAGLFLAVLHTEVFVGRAFVNASRAADIRA